MSSFQPKPFGDYYLLDHIATGGMAEVFLAIHKNHLQDPQPHHFVAIKKLLSNLSNQPEFVQRLSAEAKIAVLLEHPNIVQVYDLGVSGTDVFLTMEWVNGASLAQLIQKYVQRGESIPLALVEFIFDEVVKAVEFLYQRKDAAGRPFDLVHRDINPANILIGYQGEVKLTDFGIATAEEVSKGKKHAPALGKLPYMAPEQIRREPLSRQTDIYSLGVVLYELLTLRKPYNAVADVEWIHVIQNEPPDLDCLPLHNEPKLLDLISNCLSKDPKNRPDNASALRMESILTSSKARLEHCLVDLYREEISDREKAIDRALMAAKQVSFNAPESIDENIPRENQGGTEIIFKNDDHQATRISFKEAPPVQKKEIARVEIKKVKATELPVVVQETPTPIPQVPSDPEPSPASAVIQRPSASPTIQREYPFKFPAVWSAIAIVVLVIGYFFRDSLFRSTTQNFFNINYIDVFVSLEGGLSSIDRDDLESWMEPKRQFEVWNRPITGFFEREFKRITGKATPPFEIKFYTIRENAPSITWEGSIWLHNPLFGSLSTLHSTTLTDNKGKLFIHLYSKLPEERPRYPLDYSEERPFGCGILFLPTIREDEPEHLIRLAHEIGHLLGAKDHYNDRGIPIFPEGFVEAKKIPLYPQSNGDLMTRGVPISATEYRPFRSLNEIRINDQTAREIRWIK